MLRGGLTLPPAGGGIANLQGNYFNWFAKEGIQAGLRILQIFMILRNYDAPEQTPTSAAPGHKRKLVSTG